MAPAIRINNNLVDNYLGGYVLFEGRTALWCACEYEDIAIAFIASHDHSMIVVATGTNLNKRAALEYFLSIQKQLKGK